jgi:hypothetical protein
LSPIEVILFYFQIHEKSPEDHMTFWTFNARTLSKIINRLQGSGHSIEFVLILNSDMEAAHYQLGNHFAA